MLVYNVWKNEIKDIKSSYFGEKSLALEMMLLALVTPFIVVLDIIIIPYSMCYLIVKSIKKGCVNDEKERNN